MRDVQAGTVLSPAIRRQPQPEEETTVHIINRFIEGEIDILGPIPEGYRVRVQVVDVSEDDRVCLGLQMLDRDGESSDLVAT
jgi:hypothetical protein